MFSYWQQIFQYQAFAPKISSKLIFFIIVIVELSDRNAGDDWSIRRKDLSLVKLRYLEEALRNREIYHAERTRSVNNPVLSDVRSMLVTYTIYL